MVSGPGDPTMTSLPSVPTMVAGSPKQVGVAAKAGMSNPLQAHSSSINVARTLPKRASISDLLAPIVTMGISPNTQTPGVFKNFQEDRTGLGLRAQRPMGPALAGE